MRLILQTDIPIPILKALTLRRKDMTVVTTWPSLTMFVTSSGSTN